MNPTLVFLCVLSYYGVCSDGRDPPLDIWCLEDHVKTQKNLMKRINGTSLCSVGTTKEYPFTFGERNNTPAAPESMSYEVKVFQTSDTQPTEQIAIYISWLYRKDYFEYVESFHIELIYTEDYEVKNYTIGWDKALENVVNKSPAIHLRFNFIYTGRPALYNIKAEQTYVIHIMPMPIYGENDTAQDALEVVEIPGCTDRKIKRTHYCMTSPCYDGEVRINGECVTSPEQTTNSQSTIYSETAKANLSTTTLPNEDPLPKQGTRDAMILRILLPTIGILTLLLIGVLLILCYRKCRGTGKSATAQERTRVLLVCTSDSRYLDAVNQFITVLLKVPNVDVCCNLRQKTEIGKKGIRAWTKNEVNHSDVVCFAVANSYEVVKQEEHEEKENGRLDIVEKRQVAIVMRATETIVFNKTTENATKKFALLDLSNCVTTDASPYFQLFKLPGDMKKFMKFAIGDDATNQVESFLEEKTVFENLLSNAKLGYNRYAGRFDGDEKNVDCDSEDSPRRSSCTVLNELDHSAMESGSVSIEHKMINNISWNIFLSGPSSSDSNTSYPHTTTDFNEESQRFDQAGARPKQPRC